MKPSTELDSAVFRLTPTRTRCDLIIIAKDKKEKIASGLLNPFLAHLKAAQEQTAKGGYSIFLQPEPDVDASWFTKATLERFVRFVGTPEILERVYTIETEILQIQEAIAMQSTNDIRETTVEEHHQEPLRKCKGDDSTPHPNEEKAIVLYKPGTQAPEAIGSCLEGGNPKVQLLKVLENRKGVLQKEQGMAFARAVAAGFDIPHLSLLVSFAKCFGASRLMEACSRFTELWKRKHETGQWLEIEAAEAMSTRSDSSTMNASGIILASVANKHGLNSELASESNGKSTLEVNGDERPAEDRSGPNSQQEYFQVQFPHFMFPPWPMHSQPGAPPVFQPYPVQGMPYFPLCPGNGPYYQQPRSVMDYLPSAAGNQAGHRRTSSGGGDGRITEPEMSDIDRTRSQGDIDLDMEDPVASRRKAERSGKKQSGRVVIRNINYITSHSKKSDCLSDSDSDPGTDVESKYSEVDVDVTCKSRLKSLQRKGTHRKSTDELNAVNEEVSDSWMAYNDGNWEAFQNFLLRGSDENTCADNGAAFMPEADISIKRRANAVSKDPLANGGRDVGERRESLTAAIDRVSGTAACRPRLSGDELLLSRGNYDSWGHDNQMNFKSAETCGRKTISRTRNDDCMIGSQGNPSNFENSSDPVAIDGFGYSNAKMNKESSNFLADESFMVPFRSMSMDPVGPGDRTADIDIDSEILSGNRNSEIISGGRDQGNYEPDDLGLIPERGGERRSTGYDPALDYEMQICVYQEKTEKGASNVERGLRKSDKKMNLKVTSEALYKQKSGGPIRKGNTSKMNPSEDARVRAEKLRSFKADLQKMKKEQEAAELKRLEALKLERQKRIAARGSSSSSKKSVLSAQAKKLPTKLSPISNRGSKFSDSEPGSSSPLQRSKIRTSIGSQRSSKGSKLSDSSHTGSNRLSRSVSSLSDTKREEDGVTHETMVSMTRIRRLSEPKTISNPLVASVKVRSAEAVSKQKPFGFPEGNKISAIINLDRSKAAALPELKIKMEKVRGAEMGSPQLNRAMPCTSSEDAGHNMHQNQNDVDENPIIEKTIVMLESEKPSISTSHSSEGKVGSLNQQYDCPPKGDGSHVIHTPATKMDGVDRHPVTTQLQKRSDFIEVLDNAEKDHPKVPGSIVAEKPYQAPYACISSMEDPCTGKSDYIKALLGSSEMVSRVEDSSKARIPDVKTVRIQYPESLERIKVKEPSKGLRRLLKFGKKNHASLSVDQSVDSDGASLNGSEQDNNVGHVSSTSEVCTLKNLISQDETLTNIKVPQKASRHFSLLSFRSKTSEKKQTF